VHGGPAGASPGPRLHLPQLAVGTDEHIPTGALPGIAVPPMACDPHCPTVAHSRRAGNAWRSCRRHDRSEHVVVGLLRGCRDIDPCETRGPEPAPDGFATPWFFSRLLWSVAPAIGGVSTRAGGLGRHEEVAVHANSRCRLEGAEPWCECHLVGRKHTCEVDGPRGRSLTQHGLPHRRHSTRCQRCPVPAGRCYTLH
jgi:hypothetical protein